MFNGRTFDMHDLSYMTCAALGSENRYKSIAHTIV